MSKENQADKLKMSNAAIEEPVEISVERKLVSLYALQQIHSQIDRIRIIRGELPLEVQDLEDEIAGLETRIENYENETIVLNQNVAEKKLSMKDSASLIKRYEEQQMNVRNNREYDSLSKEIEFQNLEIQLSEKRIREYTAKIEELQKEITVAKERLTERLGDLDVKKSELQSIIEETEKEEEDLIEKSYKHEHQVEDRLIVAYKRIRLNAEMALPWFKSSAMLVEVVSIKYHRSTNWIFVCTRK